MVRVKTLSKGMTTISFKVYIVTLIALTFDPFLSGIKACSLARLYTIVGLTSSSHLDFPKNDNGWFQKKVDYSIKGNSAC